jgi:hypothetical protein
MKEKDSRDLKTLEEHFWWFKWMREITAALLILSCLRVSLIFQLSQEYEFYP